MVEHPQLQAGTFYPITTRLVRSGVLSTLTLTYITHPNRHQCPGSYKKPSFPICITSQPIDPLPGSTHCTSNHIQAPTKEASQPSRTALTDLKSHWIMTLYAMGLPTPSALTNIKSLTRKTDQEIMLQTSTRTTSCSTSHTPRKMIMTLRE